MRSMRDKAQREIDELDAWLAEMVSRCPPQHRGEPAFQEQVDDLLRQRSGLMLKRDAGFAITDKRKVRG